MKFGKGKEVDERNKRVVNAMEAIKAIIGVTTEGSDEAMQALGMFTVYVVSAAYLDEKDPNLEEGYQILDEQCTNCKKALEISIKATTEGGKDE